MKKLVFAFAAFVAISFASCGNKAANKSVENAADTTTVVETVAADSTACCDSTAACNDSTKVAE